MANEATKVELYGNNSDGDQRRFTVADANAISKGVLLQMTDPRTASFAQNWSLASSTASGAFIGIASMDKEAGDGSTAISAWTNGIFELKASGAITVGNLVYCAGNNEVKQFTAGVFGGLAASHGLLYPMSVGTALETATDGEVINVRVLK